MQYDKTIEYRRKISTHWKIYVKYIYSSKDTVKSIFLLHRQEIGNLDFHCQHLLHKYTHTTQYIDSLFKKRFLIVT